MFGKSFEEMNLVGVFHANDKIITQRHLEENKQAKELHEVLWAANRIQTFILLNNFDGDHDAKLHFQSLILQPVIETLSNVFNLLKEDNPINLVYITHCSHDIQIIQALSFLNYFPEIWDQTSPVFFNSSLRFEVMSKVRFAEDL